MNTSSTLTHKGPHPGVLALLYTVLFCFGLHPLTALYKQPYWPGPWEPASVIVPYFQTYGARVLFCLVLQLGGMICLGIFVATVVRRLQSLGARAVGIYIALLGCFLVVADAITGATARRRYGNEAFPQSSEKRRHGTMQCLLLWRN
jgi:hypothetical protein